ncbi:MAG: hypothetical protein HYX28_01015 [Candidatus Koribacter versatilis]|uniref:Uncharacterized protein n=1 Tax=Candidatus Korobacter versatilis TaxID=658062 RepID=A0A932A715_9BACT|nr:hypothetical protein [Candidatus Koribacter versatilis]
MSPSAAPVLATVPKPQPIPVPARPVGAERVNSANAAPRCRHQKVNGVRCGSPAVHHRKYCYYHEKFYSPNANDIPCLEDANSVAYMINCVVRGINSGYMDLRAATSLLYAAQNMIPLLKQLYLEPSQDELAGAEPENDAAENGGAEIPRG